MMLVWDTVTSYGLTPFSSDFINYVEFDITVKEVTKLNRVIVIGTTLHQFIEIHGQDIFFQCVSYHLTQTDVRLSSTQTYHQMNGGHYIVQGDQVTMHFPFHRIHIPVDIERTNLPVVHNSFVTEHQKKLIGPHICSSLAYTRFSELDIFGDLNTI